MGYLVGTESHKGMGLLPENYFEVGRSRGKYPASFSSPDPLKVPLLAGPNQKPVGEGAQGDVVQRGQPPGAYKRAKKDG